MLADPTPNLVLAGDLDEVDILGYLGSFNAPLGRVSNSVCAHTKARMAFANWRRLYDIQLSTRGRVWAPPVRSLLIYRTETWPLRTDMQGLLEFEISCLCGLGRSRG